MRTETEITGCVSRSSPMRVDRHSLIPRSSSSITRSENALELDCHCWIRRWRPALFGSAFLLSVGMSPGLAQVVLLCGCTMMIFGSQGRPSVRTHLVGAIFRTRRKPTSNGTITSHGCAGQRGCRFRDGSFDSQVTPVVRLPWPGLGEVCGGCGSAASGMAARRARMRDQRAARRWWRRHRVLL
jgi:hypothetical protein